MFRIRRFGVVRTANLVAVMYLIIFAVIFVPILALVAALGARSGAFGGAGGVGVLIFGLVASVFYAIVGWVVTAIACALYNGVAGMIGGIEIELEAVQPPPPAPGLNTWGAPPPPPAAPPPATPPSA